jgi:tetratricopeptide (TPR) repeat protein
MSKDAQAAFQTALFLEESGDLPGATAEYARATDLDGTDPRFWIARGVALLQLRHHDEAARCLITGIDLKPHYGEADARVFLADALWQSGRKADAGWSGWPFRRWNRPTPATTTRLTRPSAASRSAVQHDIAAADRPSSLRSGGRSQLNVRPLGGRRTLTLPGHIAMLVREVIGRKPQSGDCCHA